VCFKVCVSNRGRWLFCNEFTTFGEDLNSRFIVVVSIHLPGRLGLVAIINLFIVINLFIINASELTDLAMRIMLIRV